ncbi:hypothetical protein VP01_380g3 [Puccinia sorghi]|uniref:Uncharacterized protein n=1 Tax=Puccinia sorghi TaxID=27349 RepID=A0A0L6UTG7_9BASI|nr:hypothetical protein VP01_380g3 [Puccinia sorghi]
MHSDCAVCTVTVHQSMAESLLEKGWSNDRSFLGVSASQIQAKVYMLEVKAEGNSILTSLKLHPKKNSHYQYGVFDFIIAICECEILERSVNLIPLFRVFVLHAKKTESEGLINLIIIIYHCFLTKRRQRCPRQLHLNRANVRPLNLIEAQFFGKRLWCCVSNSSSKYVFSGHHVVMNPGNKSILYIIGKGYDKDNVDLFPQWFNLIFAAYIWVSCNQHATCFKPKFLTIYVMELNSESLRFISETRVRLKGIKDLKWRIERIKRPMTNNDKRISEKEIGGKMRKLELERCCGNPLCLYRRFEEVLSQLEQKVEWDRMMNIYYWKKKITEDSQEEIQQAHSAQTPLVAGRAGRASSPFFVRPVNKNKTRLHISLKNELFCELISGDFCININSLGECLRSSNSIFEENQSPSIISTTPKGEVMELLIMNSLLTTFNGLCHGASEAEDQWSYCCVIHWLQHGNLPKLPPFLGLSHTADAQAGMAGELDFFSLALLSMSIIDEISMIMRLRVFNFWFLLHYHLSITGFHPPNMNFIDTMVSTLDMDIRDMGSIPLIFFSEFHKGPCTMSQMISPSVHMDTSCSLSTGRLLGNTSEILLSWHDQPSQSCRHTVNHMKARFFSIQNVGIGGLPSIHNHSSPMSLECLNTLELCFEPGNSPQSYLMASENTIDENEKTLNVTHITGFRWGTWGIVCISLSSCPLFFILFLSCRKNKFIVFLLIFIIFFLLSHTNMCAIYFHKNLMNPMMALRILLHFSPLDSSNSRKNVALKIWVIKPTRLKNMIQQGNFLMNTCQVTCRKLQFILHFSSTFLVTPNIYLMHKLTVSFSLFSMANHPNESNTHPSKGYFLSCLCMKIWTLNARNYPLPPSFEDKFNIIWLSPHSRNPKYYTRKNVYMLPLILACCQNQIIDLKRFFGKST